jgi:hypothetical protein
VVVVVVLVVRCRRWLSSLRLCGAEALFPAEQHHGCISRSTSAAPPSPGPNHPVVRL